jgi:transcription initiation factor TFIID subunit 1
MDFEKFLNERNGSAEENSSGEYVDEYVPAYSSTYKPRIKFLDLLVAPKNYDYQLRKYKIRKVPVESLGYEVDDQTRFKNSLAFVKVDNPTMNCLSSSSRNVALRRHLRKKQFEKSMGERIERLEKVELEEPPSQKVEHSFDVIDWEKSIIYNEGMIDADISNVGKVMATREFVDSILEDEDWEDHIIYDTRNIQKLKTYLILRVNDPNLIFEKTEDKKKVKSKRKHKDASLGDRPLKSKYNISNDKYYNIEAVAKSSLGNLGVQHSIPALKLHNKFYKTFLSRDELRNFHRPPLSVEPGAKITSSPLFDGGCRSTNMIKMAGELTLKAGCKFALFEYSEEIPICIMNPGMVSLLTTFYRKNNLRDEYTNLEYSHISVLDVDDPSPFNGFGDVKPGESTLALTNNLFKAPVFPHKSDDFLCILERKEDNKYLCYVRKIENISCVGQTLVLEEVYSPHSRKFNVYCRNRFRVCTYRLFYRRDNRDRTLRLTQLDDLFPHFSEGSKRKWLKEYADCIKKGKDNIWVLKPSASLFTEEDLEKLVTPENVCQYESMLAGERRLKDVGYDLHGDVEEECDEEELALSPWNLSRNFVNACNGRGQLRLSGIGDPTGLGEGFSFLRVQQKKTSENDTKKQSNEAMARYKEEIERIWKRQKDSLSSDRDIPYEEVEELVKEEAKRKEELSNQSHLKEDIPYIKIIRTYLRDGKEETEEEIISDMMVIKAYLKARKNIKTEEKKAGMRCGSCGQPGHMKTNRVCPNFSETPKTVSRKKKENIKRKAKTFLMEIVVKTINSLFSTPLSTAFHRPVSLKKFPDYTKFVTNPIDLTSMRSKARQYKYRKFKSFIGDLILMRSNCIEYNGPEHSFTKTAGSMIEKAEEIYRENIADINKAEEIVKEEDDKASTT